MLFCRCCDTSHEVEAESMAVVTVVSAMDEPPLDEAPPPPPKVADPKSAAVEPLVVQAPAEEEPKAPPADEAPKGKETEDAPKVNKEGTKRKKNQRADETVDYVNPLTITVDRSNGLKLGLIAYNNEGEDFMRIRSINEDGLIGKWNASHEGIDEQLVKIGYHIVGVNDKQLPNEMKTEIIDVSITKVVLTLRRAVPK
mmetsp:Transcript_14091/g.31891  ORF Transcript_14091/g.31891 Transcript_14091/m.31891 type:complete len:198 (+) Transcript_14091:91-684(+)